MRGGRAGGHLLAEDKVLDGHLPLLDLPELPRDVLLRTRTDIEQADCVVSPLPWSDAATHSARAGWEACGRSDQLQLHRRDTRTARRAFTLLRSLVADSRRIPRSSILDTAGQESLRTVSMPFASNVGAACDGVVDSDPGPSRQKNSELGVRRGEQCGAKRSRKLRRRTAGEREGATQGTPVPPRLLRRLVHHAAVALFGDQEARVVHLRRENTPSLNSRVLTH